MFETIMAKSFGHDYQISDFLMLSCRKHRTQFICGDQPAVSMRLLEPHHKEKKAFWVNLVYYLRLRKKMG